MGEREGTTQSVTSASPWARWWVRRLIAPLTLLLIAVAPWLIPWPWQNSAANAVDAPAIVIPRIGASATPTKPTDDTVDRLGKRISGQPDAYDLPVDRAEVKGVSTKPGPYRKLGRIKIARIGLDVAFAEGVFEETLNRGPGHWPGTPMPGRIGNAVISGHRNTNTQPFKRIDELDPGDKITMSMNGQSPVSYVVQDTTIVPEKKYREFVLRQPKSDKNRQLTIFACHPEGKPVYRIVVRATARD